MSDRKLYRIIRGTYSRRDGEVQTIKDNQGNVIKKARAYVIYQAKTPANPHVRDEVEMTDLEAFRFGLNRLEPLVRRSHKTLDVTNAPDEGEADASREDTIRALIETGNETTGKKKIDAWRKTVVNSELLDEVPDTKAEIIEALEALLEGEAGSEE